MSPLTFVCWRWLSPVGYRSIFEPSTVYALKAMIERHYPHPHRFVCMTDRPKELPGIEAIELSDFAASIPSPFGRHNPSCYRRLMVFAPDAGKVFGERLVSMDLDTVITGDLTPLFAGEEDFKIWGCSDFPSQWYNGSLYLLRTGTRTKVWTEFDPDRSPELTQRARCFGSDQGWIRYILGSKEATWGEKDGVYSFRKHLAPRGEYLPENAKVVNFHGKIDPWHQKAQQFAWIRAHYPQAVSA